MHQALDTLEVLWLYPGACPPEDCGGVHGYYGTLEILRNPRHDEYKHTKTWIESMTGGPFDPDAFDVDAVNAALNALR